MSHCETLREDLKAYMDGQLPPVPRVALRLHLAQCAACREEIEAMRRIGQELKTGDAGTLEPDLRAKILARIPDAAPPAGEAERAASRWKRRPMILWGATATVLLAWILVSPFFRQERFMQAQVSADQAERSNLAGGSSAAGAPQAPAADSEVVAQYAAPPAGPPASLAPSEMAKSEEKAATPQMMAEGRSRQDMALPAAPGLAGGGVAANAPSRSVTHKVNESGGSFGNALASGKSALPMQRQVQKAASLTVAVEKLEEQSDRVEQMVKTAGGFVATNQLSTGDEGLKAATLEVRVPVEKFETFLRDVSKLGEVKAKNVTGQDITEQVSDEREAGRVLREEIAASEAKIKAKKAQETNPADAESLRQLKMQAAQTQARLEMLHKLAALANVTVELREKAKPAPPTGGFFFEMQNTGQAALQSFAYAVRLPLQMLIWIVAYAPLWAVLLLAYRYAMRA